MSSPRLLRGRRRLRGLRARRGRYAARAPLLALLPPPAPLLRPLWRAGCFVDSEVKARVTLQLAPVGRPSQPRVMIRLTTGAQGGASRRLVMSDDH